MTLKVSLGELAGLVVTTRKTPQKPRPCGKCAAKEERIKRLLIKNKSQYDRILRLKAIVDTGKSHRLDHRRAWAAEYYEKLKAAGTCVVCKKPRDESPSMSQCSACRERSRLRSLKYNATRIRPCTICKTGKTRKLLCRKCAGRKKYRDRLSWAAAGQGDEFIKKEVVASSPRTLPRGYVKRVALAAQLHRYTVGRYLRGDAMLPDVAAAIRAAIEKVSAPEAQQI